jgi:hypothetical protein
MEKREIMYYLNGKERWIAERRESSKFTSEVKGTDVGQIRAKPYHCNCSTFIKQSMESRIRCYKFPIWHYYHTRLKIMFIAILGA